MTSPNVTTPIPPPITAPENRWSPTEAPGLERNGYHASHRIEFPNLPELPSPDEASRDPFAPGDKVYWPLPTLADTHEEPDPATRASDWFEMVGPIMSDLTPMSGVWWSRVVAEAHAWYELWTQSPAVERGLLRPSPSQELQSLRYRRLESRAYAMLLAAWNNP